MNGVVFQISAAQMAASDDAGCANQAKSPSPSQRFTNPVSSANA